MLFKRTKKVVMTKDQETGIWYDGYGHQIDDLDIVRYATRKIVNESKDNNGNINVKLIFREKKMKK